MLPVGRSGVILSQLNHPAHLCPCLRFDDCLAAGHARLGVRMGRYSFPVRLFHSLLHAGFDRRTAKPIFIKLCRYTTASRTVEQLKIATARPLKNTGRNACATRAERGVSNREGDTRYLCFTTLCQESIPAALSPRFRSLQWAATPKLTMIAGAGNFPSGSSRCESFLFNPTIPDENLESNGQKRGKCAEGL